MINDVSVTGELVSMLLCMEGYKFNYHMIRHLMASYGIANSTMTPCDFLEYDKPTVFSAIPSINNVAVDNTRLFEDYKKSISLIPRKSTIKRQIKFLKFLKTKNIDNWDSLKLSIMSIENCEVFGEDVVKDLYSIVIRAEKVYISINELFDMLLYSYKELVKNELYIPDSIEKSLKKFKKHSYTIDTIVLENTTDKLAYLSIFTKVLKDYRSIDEYNINFTTLAKIFSRELSGVMKYKDSIEPKDIELQSNNSNILSNAFSDFRSVNNRESK